MPQLAPGHVDLKKLLGRVERFPSDTAQSKFKRLISVISRGERLASDLHLIFNPALAGTWAKKHHADASELLGLLEDMVPLFIFEGDVGTGKTALAETIGDLVARTYGYDVLMVRMSTQVRGTGYVGEMGTMLAAAFEHVLSLWRKEGAPVILIIDEADSLLTSRSAKDHHHEDKAGVNTILQHLEGIKQDAAQVAVIAITNRLAVLDPAVARRATALETFQRPSQEERKELFERLFGSLGWKHAQIIALVDASEPRQSGHRKSPLPFSWSDLTLRFAVPAIRDAIRRDAPLHASELAQQLRGLNPSPNLDD